MPKILATFRIDEALWDRFLDRAKLEETSATKKINELIAQYLGIRNINSVSSLAERLQQLEEMLNVATEKQCSTTDWLSAGQAYRVAGNRGYMLSRATFFRQLNRPSQFEFTGVEADPVRQAAGEPWVRLTGKPVSVRKRSKKTA